MQAKKKGLLQIPQGTESIYLEEAFRHRRIIQEVEKLFTGWGYLPAQVPVFDFFDIYRDLLDDASLSLIYRLIDRDGELLMLRSDITLFLAKHMGAVLSKEDLPLRVWYADTILRHQDREDISRNEFFQVGAELIGKPGIRGDIEVFALLVDILGELGIPETYIHVGSRKLFEAVAAPMNERDRNDLAHYITVRDTGAIFACVAGYYDGDAAEEYGKIFCFLGDLEELYGLKESLNRGSVSQELFDELNNLERIASTILQVYPNTAIRVDLSEIGSQPYYTGVVFQAYMNGADRAVASGGRYDQLIGHFGFACPSVGFSLLLRKAEGRIPDLPRFSVPKPEEIEEKNSAIALAEAKKVRLAGGVATI